MYKPASRLELRIMFVCVSGTGKFHELSLLLYALLFAIVVWWHFIVELKTKTALVGRLWKYEAII